jgi:hypothetical protein
MTLASPIATLAPFVDDSVCCSDSDRRFNQAFDKESGYRTRSILCLPIRNKGEVIGVIEVRGVSV